MCVHIVVLSLRLASTSCAVAMLARGGRDAAVLAGSIGCDFGEMVMISLLLLIS
jgi:hypothetical protein